MSDLPRDRVPFEAIVQRFKSEKVQQTIQAIPVVRVSCRRVVFEEAIKIVDDALVDKLRQFRGIRFRDLPESLRSE